MPADLDPEWMAFEVYIEQESDSESDDGEEEPSTVNPSSTRPSTSREDTPGLSGALSSILGVARTLASAQASTTPAPILQTLNSVHVAPEGNRTILTATLPQQACSATGPDGCGTASRARPPPSAVAADRPDTPPGPSVGSVITGRLPRGAAPPPGPECQYRTLIARWRRCRRPVDARDAAGLPTLGGWPITISQSSAPDPGT